jgi:glycosyltransferase involved in cell wall biosynthesis
MKKVLVITYFWPPSGKASLHLPLKIVKYLPQFDWTPVVLTVKEDTFSDKDESLLKDVSPDLIVAKTKTFEPFNMYRKAIGKKTEEPLIASETISKENEGMMHKLSVWIRMNLFIPDARIGWFFSAVKKGKQLFKEHKFDAVLSFGPPHTAHLIGKYLSRRFKVNHFPVFIDPWTDIIYYKNFKRSKPTIMIDNYLEKKVLQNCKKAVFVTQTMESDYLKKYPWLSGKTFVSYWGYNEEDFSEGSFRDSLNFSTTYEEETVVHAGNIFDYQNPVNFWKQLKHEIDNGRRIKLKFIGTVSPAIKKTISGVGLESHTEYSGFLPYKEMLNELAKATYLLVCATEPRHLPGKLFEYLRTGKPIIAFGNDNKDVKGILEESNAGMLFRYNESGKEFFERAEQFSTDFDTVKKFDRKEITRLLAEMMSNS